MQSRSRSRQNGKSRKGGVGVGLEKKDLSEVMKFRMNTQKAVIAITYSKETPECTPKRC